MLKKSFLFFQAALLFTSAALAQAEGSRKEGSATQKKPVLALKGHDPVELVQGKKTKGIETLFADHDGFHYLFANAKNLAAFQSSPEKYVVQNHGFCPVAKSKMRQDIPGDPAIYSVHAGKIYFFANEDARAMFEQNPAAFVPGGKKEGSGRR